MQTFILLLFYFCDLSFLVFIQHQWLIYILNCLHVLVYFLHKLVVIHLFQLSSSLLRITNLLQLLFYCVPYRIVNLFPSTKLPNKLLTRQVSFRHLLMPDRLHYLLLQLTRIRSHRPCHELIEKSLSV